MTKKRPNVCHWCLDCHGLTEEVLRLLRHKRCGAMFDFQTGGPIVSPLLLIYMCWKSNKTITERTVPYC